MCYVWTYIQRIIFSIKKNFASSEKKIRPNWWVFLFFVFFYIVKQINILKKGKISGCMLIMYNVIMHFLKSHRIPIWTMLIYLVLFKTKIEENLTVILFSTLVILHMIYPLLWLFNVMHFILENTDYGIDNTCYHLPREMLW